MRATYRVLVALMFAANGAASAFEVDGLRSGMSAAEVATVFAERGLEAWEFRGGMWAYGIRSQSRVDGTLTFASCNKQGLVAYIKDLDSDTDFLPVLERNLSTWGQPKVSVRRQAWSGPGEVQTIEMLWKRAADEITLTLSPEARDGKGALRHHRSASISYLDSSRLCSPR